MLYAVEIKFDFYRTYLLATFSISLIVLTCYSLGIPPAHYQIHHIFVVSDGIVADTSYTVIFGVSVDVLYDLIYLGVGDEISIA